MIGHIKTDGHLGRCYLEGDAANVILSAVGCNLRLMLAWLGIPLGLILLALCRASAGTPTLKWASPRKTNSNKSE